MNIQPENINLGWGAVAGVEYDITTNKQLIAGYLTLLIMFVGVLGNLLTVVALAQNKRIRNVTATFIIGLCVADCIFCAVVLPFNAARFLTGGGTRDDLLCKIVPFVQYGNVGISLLFITMITINRYIMIAHYNIHTKVYRPICVILMILFCIAISFGMQLPTLYGIWGQYQYNDKLQTCTIVPDEWGRSSKSALMIIGFVIPCVIIICCYARIFWVVHSSEKRILEHAKRNYNNQHRQQQIGDENKKKRNEWRITKMVLVIFLSFLACYLPLTFIKVVDQDVQYFTLHLISYLMLYMSSCINPIIYVIMNKQYRKAYKSVLCCQSTNVFSRNSTGDVNSP